MFKLLVTLCIALALLAALPVRGTPSITEDGVIYLPEDPISTLKKEIRLKPGETVFIQKSKCSKPTKVSYFKAEVMCSPEVKVVGVSLIEVDRVAKEATKTEVWRVEVFASLYAIALMAIAMLLIRFNYFMIALASFPFTFICAIVTAPTSTFTIAAATIVAAFIIFFQKESDKKVFYGLAVGFEVLIASFLLSVI